MAAFKARKIHPSTIQETNNNGIPTESNDKETKKTEPSNENIQTTENAWLFSLIVFVLIAGGVVVYLATKWSDSIVPAALEPASFLRTPNPSASPSTSAPSSSPTLPPTRLPSLAPTVDPTPTPTARPSSGPTLSPTQSPSLRPTTRPSISPSSRPTTSSPTPGPTLPPSVAPTPSPTIMSPSLAPSIDPTSMPTPRPSPGPTLPPTQPPSHPPTKKPTSAPSSRPTTAPSVRPTPGPSVAPTQSPTTSRPSTDPTPAPTPRPTPQPSPGPTLPPTQSPTLHPTKQPTISPSSQPTTPLPTVTPPLRVACVGDSLTLGAFGGLPFDHSYPAQLQQMLGETFEVHNYGKNSATALRGLSSSYITSGQFELSLNMEPDIYLLMLGTNDAKYWEVNGREVHGQLYRKDMKRIIYKMRSTSEESPPRIILAIPPWVKTDAYGIRNEVLVNSVQPAIQIVAMVNDLQLVNMYDVTYNQTDSFIGDGLHLNKQGFRSLAETWKEAVLCNPNGICETGESCTTCPQDCHLDCS